MAHPGMPIEPTQIVAGDVVSVSAKFYSRPSACTAVGAPVQTVGNGVSA